MTSYAQPEGVVASASAEQGAECCRLSEGPPSSTCRPPPPLPLPRLPLGVKPQFVGEWNSGDFRAHLRDFVWTALARVGILSSLIALVVGRYLPSPPLSSHLI